MDLLEKEDIKSCFEKSKCSELIFKTITHLSVGSENKLVFRFN